MMELGLAEQQANYVCGTELDLQVSMQHVQDNLARAERVAASREMTAAYRARLRLVEQVRAAFICAAGVVNKHERPAVLMLFRSLERRTRGLIVYAQRLEPRSDGGGTSPEGGRS